MVVAISGECLCPLPCPGQNLLLSIRQMELRVRLDAFGTADPIVDHDARKQLGNR